MTTRGRTGLMDGGKDFTDAMNGLGELWDWCRISLSFLNFNIYFRFRFGAVYHSLRILGLTLKSGLENYQQTELE